MNQNILFITQTRFSFAKAKRRDAPEEPSDRSGRADGSGRRVTESLLDRAPDLGRPCQPAGPISSLATEESEIPLSIG